MRWRHFLRALGRAWAKAGMRVGVIGIGGLGHFAILFAKALGCTIITAISRKSNKKENAFKLGADKFIATDEDPNWSEQNAKSLDLVICTVSSHNMPLSGYIDLLAIKGNLILVGAPEEDLPRFNASSLLDKRAKIGGSAIGSPQQIREMLELAVEKQIHPWINVYPMADANRAIVEFEEGTPRYRFVLQNDPKSTQEATP